MNARSSRKPDAWRFIEWASGRVPAPVGVRGEHEPDPRQRVGIDPRFAEHVAGWGDFAAVARDLVENRAAVLVTPSVRYLSIGDRWVRALREAYAGTAGVAEALEQAAADIDAIAARRNSHDFAARHGGGRRCQNRGVGNRRCRQLADRRRAWEEDGLSPLATAHPGVREVPRRTAGCATPFQRDRDRIVHCKAFRRLKHKTQVFVAPEGDHYRTRLTHTLETTQISRTVARALGLNEDLDGGDRARARPRPPAVRPHRRGRARPLRCASASAATSATTSTRCGSSTARAPQPHRAGARRHPAPLGPGRGEPATLEGKIVRLVDRIAYINHDIDDAVRAGVLRVEDLPLEEIAVLGDTGSRRIDRLVHDLVEHSAEAGDIVQGEEVGGAMLRLRGFMFQNVYLGPAGARGAREDRARHARAVRVVLRAPGGAAARPTSTRSEADRVIDYLAGMTDRFAIRAWTERAVPQGLLD